jgi:hypothetical protein
LRGEASLNQTVNNNYFLPKLGNFVVATFKSQIVCFTLVEIRELNGKKRLHISFRLSMASGNTYMQFLIPAEVARQLIGLSTFDGIYICGRIFSDQRVRLRNGQPVLLPNATISDLFKKAKESGPAVDTSEQPYDEGLAPQSREPPRS